jgi:hypothetical protein
VLRVPAAVRSWPPEGIVTPGCGGTGLVFIGHAGTGHTRASRKAGGRLALQCNIAALNRCNALFHQLKIALVLKHLRSFFFTREKYVALQQ